MMIKTTRTLHQRPLWPALLACAALAGAASAAVAADDMTRPEAAAAEPGKAVAPNRQETAESAFKKLDATGKGYLTLDDVAVLPGFDKAFQAADVSKSGKLTLADFKKAWSAYTGKG